MKAAIAILTICLLGFAQANIKGTVILFRHGQRTPVSAGQLDSSLIEDLGEGQLTNIGSRQLYQNGVFLRLKYKDLFPADGFFRLSKMRIMSSLPERTMMSLQSFMAGFFPPPLADTSLPIRWQPFFTTVDHKGEIVYFDESACPRYVQYLYGFIANPPTELIQWVKDDAAILSQLSAWANTPLDNAMEVMMFAELVRAQKFLDPNIPEWVIEAYYSYLEKYVAMMLSLMHFNHEMVKIRAGPLLGQILNNLEGLIAGSSDAAPILIYSAHDATIISLAFGLGVQDQIPSLPNYSDTFMIDLTDDGNVSVIYMNTEKLLHTRTTMNVPGCGTSCSVATLRKAVANVLVDNMAKLCAV